MTTTTTTTTTKLFKHLCVLGVGAGAVVFLAFASAACSTPSKGALERTVSTRATPGSFRSAGVTTVFEKRCGSLDCHGNPGRNMRIYSSRGLRLPNDGGLTVGVGDTTLDEITANYQSILTLEPEQTNKVLDGDDPNTLLVVKKPLAIESHKGGQTIKHGDDAETCILSWLKEDLTAPVDKNACATAAIFPKE